MLCVWHLQLFTAFHHCYDALEGSLTVGLSPTTLTIQPTSLIMVLLLMSS